ncbi:MAG: glutathione peroxidase [Chitinophagaceae bacterium]|nr:MAG: glutathione peroxidase [Chitinophagaceae bacterium]
MKSLLLILFFIPIFSIAQKKSIYDFNVDALTGGTIHFKDFKGKKILIVNTASKCGNTPQYKQLEELYEKYRDKLVIIGFPANNFLGQEPGSNEEIAAFCEKNYGVTFPMAAKISVKGKKQAAIYKYLHKQAKEKGLDNPVVWNFGKFLLDENGELIATFSPKTSPTSDKIIALL